MKINMESNDEVAHRQLISFVQLYNTLSKEEKFSLGKIFHAATKGKMSPFNSPEPVVVGLIPVIDSENSIKFLGVRRGISPFIGELALPSGFLESHEDSKEGLARELLEETTINISPSELSIFDIQTTPGNQLLIFMVGNRPLSHEEFVKGQHNIAHLNQHIDEDDEDDDERPETQELVLLDSTDTLCFPLHQKALLKAVLEFT